MTAVVEVFALSAFAVVQTNYVHLALNRGIEMLVISELVFNLLVFISYSLHLPTRSCSLIRIPSSALLVGVT